jgi:hypothetical protein
VGHDDGQAEGAQESALAAHVGAADEHERVGGGEGEAVGDGAGGIEQGVAQGLAVEEGGGAVYPFGPDKFRVFVGEAWRGRAGPPFRRGR